jgi:Spy/CpxP family protein refolding chaperone
VKSWTVICAALVIFAAGLVTGVFADRAAVAARTEHVSPPPPFQGRPDHRRFLEKLDKELNLTPDQHKQIEGLLAASQDRIKKLWEPVRPKVHEEYHQTREEINKLLTPEQQELYKKMRAKMGRPEGRERDRKDGEPKSGAQTNAETLPSDKSTVPPGR